MEVIAVVCYCYKDYLKLDDLSTPLNGNHENIALNNLYRLKELQMYETMLVQLAQISQKKKKLIISSVENFKRNIKKVENISDSTRQSCKAVVISFSF